jgi:hypothetical protein
MGQRRERAGGRRRRSADSARNVFCPQNPAGAREPPTHTTLEQQRCTRYDAGEQEERARPHPHLVTSIRHTQGAARNVGKEGGSRIHHLFFLHFFSLDFTACKSCVYLALRAVVAWRGWVPFARFSAASLASPAHGGVAASSSGDASPLTSDWSSPTPSSSSEKSHHHLASSSSFLHECPRCRTCPACEAAQCDECEECAVCSDPTAVPEVGGAVQAESSVTHLRV